MNYLKTKGLEALERFLTVLTACLCTMIAFNMITKISGTIRITGNLELIKFMFIWAVISIVLNYIVRVIAIAVTHLIIYIKLKFVKRKEELK